MHVAWFFFIQQLFTVCDARNKQTAWIFGMGTKITYDLKYRKLQNKKQTENV